MITVGALVEAVGSAVLRLVSPGDGRQVDDVTLAEPDSDIVGTAGDLVLGVGLTGPERALDLVERSGRAGACGLVLRAEPAQDPRVVTLARGFGLAVVELAAHASWAHVVWILRGMIDRAAAPQSPALGDVGVHGELFALADAAAAIVDAPVTIEDARSRVLAYSSRQDLADPARISTIVGRKVPEHLISHFRARGVFRKLARSDEPVYVPSGPGGTLPRLVVPVRAGGEWLGSIWAAVPGPVEQARIDELVRAASVLALHLLRLRAQVDLARRATTDELRALLLEARSAGGQETWLPEGPWRVAGLLGASVGGGPRPQLDLWETITRRFGWQQPLLADVEGLVLAVVTTDGDAARAGSVDWMRSLAASVSQRDPELTVTIGGVAADRSELARSRNEAAELGRLVAAGRLRGPLVDVGQVWATVTVERALAAVRPEDGLLGGPLASLIAYDRRHQGALVRTLSAWLDHPSDPRAAAAALHVHPNTLRHRMTRIGEVGLVDLDSPTVRLALRLQLGALGHRPSSRRGAGQGPLQPGQPMS